MGVVSGHVMYIEVIHIIIDIRDSGFSVAVVDIK